jgi:GNAT superfamily N-acetyltransferase
MTSYNHMYPSKFTYNTFLTDTKRCYCSSTSKQHDKPLTKQHVSHRSDKNLLTKQPHHRPIIPPTRRNPTHQPRPRSLHSQHHRLHRHSPKWRPIACGGLRLIDEEASTSIAEIKRVYVVPEARGQAKGISDFLLKQLELHAADMGWKTLRLQTSKNMIAANRFYERHGYGLIPNYGEYVDSSSAVSYEKLVV